MRQLFKVVGIVFCLLLLVTILIFERTKLIRQGNYNLAGLNSDVSVYFDQFGIPHIKGEKSTDVLRALGFIMASERLFQMELLRRMINGELSAVLGEKFISSDTLLRTLELKKSAKDFLANRSDQIPYELMQDMEAYIAGIHDYINQGVMPVDFILAGFRPGRFEVADLMAVTSYMAMGFSEGMSADILFSELMENLPDEKVEILRIGEKSDRSHFKSIPVLDQESINAVEKIESTFLQIQDLIPLFHGSNGWVLSGKKTQSGYPLLANDPHISTSNPHILYEAHIEYPGMNLYGHYLPLGAFPIVGHTTEMAWGLTMAEVDDVTIYSEKINPENEKQVMFNNEWVDMEIREESIFIKGGKEKKILIKRTPHGPIISDTSLGVSGKALSLHWSVYHQDNNVVRAMYEIPRSNTIEKLRAALDHAAAPGLSVLYANKFGDIASWMMGKFPKLPEGVPYDLVLNGWNGTHEVERYYSIDENPHQVNPEEGFIVAANYKPEQKEFSHFDGYWQAGERFYRLKRLIREKKKWNLEDVMALQTDLTVEGHQKYQQILLSSLNRPELSSLETLAVELFRKWDGKTDIASVGASLFYSWLSFTEKNVFLDELGEKNFKRFSKTADSWHALKQLFEDKDHSFWDNVRTNRVESGDEILRKSFQQTVELLSKRLGDNAFHWQWGQLHKAWYKHPIGEVWPLNLIYNIGPLPSPGGRYVINQLSHKRLTNNFTITSAPAVRRIIDFSNLQETRAVLPTGNSGNPFSEFFSDQILLYNKGDYRLQLMDWSTIEKLPRLILKAARNNDGE